MDVDGMMREMTLAELIEIDSRLDRSMEEKREELRQMVGRRYRDVLDAAVGVRRVRACGDALVTHVRAMRAANCNGGIHTRHATRNTATIVGATQHIAALHRIIALIDTSDALGNAFLVVAAETISRHLSVATQLDKRESRLVRHFAQRIRRARIAIEERLVGELGALADPVEHVTCQLVAIAMLKQASMADLLEVYVQQRQLASSTALHDGGSLLELITGLRSTLRAIQTLFIDGVLAGVIARVANGEWRPAVVDELLGDESLAFATFLQAILRDAHSRRPFAAAVANTVKREEVCRRCAIAIEQISALGHAAVTDMTRYMDSLSAIVDFLAGIDDMLRCSDWPQAVCADVNVYQLLFGGKLIERFQTSIHSELTAIGDFALSELAVIDCTPLSLWQTAVDLNLQTRTVSPELNKLCDRINARLKSVHSLVAEYVRLGQEENRGDLENAVKAAAGAFVQRLAAMPDPAASLDGDWLLRRARLCICMCETCPALKACIADGEAYAAARAALAAAIDRFLMKWIDICVPQWIHESNMETIVEACANHDNWLQYTQDWEEVPVAAEGGGVGGGSSVWVPVQMSSLLFAFARRVCVVQAHVGGGHRFSRPVRNHLAATLGTAVKDIYSRCNPASSRIALQLLFDVRACMTLFACADLDVEKRRLEAMIDPFDLDLVAIALRRNIARALHRTSVMFGFVTAGELPVSKDASSNVQCVPIVPTPARFNLLPLVAAYQEPPTALGSGGGASTKPGLRKSTPATVSSTDTFRSTPSLASFYDKISTSWWGGN